MFKVMLMKIGIIGCGNIAHNIAKSFQVQAVYDVVMSKCEDIDANVCNNVDELIDECDFIVEAASPQAVIDYAPKIIEKGKDMLIMSVGGLEDVRFREKIFTLARKNGAHIYLPSGAIGGIDLIKSAKVAGLKKVTLRSTKNSKTLGYNVKERTLVFKGKASEAIKKFPKSVNVSVLLSIVAGMDIDVEVYADPDVKENIHEILVEGDFGEAEIRVRNKPSPQNPKTSHLAVLSPIYLISSLNDVIRMGV